MWIWESKHFQLAVDHLDSSGDVVIQTCCGGSDSHPRHPKAINEVLTTSSLTTVTTPEPPAAQPGDAIDYSQRKRENLGELISAPSSETACESVVRTGHQSMVGGSEA